MDFLARLKIELNKEISAEGKNSKVFLALDPQLNADIVIKKIPKSEFHDVDEYYSEAQKLYYTQHPHIMKINLACEDDQFIYLSMPFCRNGSLNALLEKRFLTVREVIYYALGFLSGLHFIHSKGLIHFDVKPSNVMIDNSNKAVVTDFGLAKYVDDSGFASQDVFYSTHRPPESFTVTDLTNAADIYQVGLTLYRMCNGNANFKEQLRILNITDFDKLERSILSGTFPDRKSFLSHIPKKLQNIIKRALAINVDDRYDTILDMINDLSEVDQNLDWVYYPSSITAPDTWILEGNTHIDRIELVNRGSNWNIEGKKIRKSDNRTTKNSKYCSTGHNTKEKALKTIAKMILESN